MRSLYKIYVALVLLAGILGCDSKDDLVLPDDINEQLNNPPLGVTYEDVTSGLVDSIGAGAPVWEGTEEVSFRFKEINSDAPGELPGNVGSLIVLDRETGFVSLQSNSNISITSLAFGNYYISIFADYLGGSLSYDSTLLITLVDLQFTLSYDLPAEVSYGFVGDIAFPALGGLNGASVQRYELKTELEGIVIDEATGILQKTNKNTPDGSFPLTIWVYTDQGLKKFTDVVMLTVGDKPVVNYLNPEGAIFSRLEVSPWTAVPAIHISESAQDLGNSLTFAFVSSPFNGISIDPSSGIISIPEDLGTADGEYPVSVLINADGDELVYDSMFIIKVELNWEDEIVENFTGAPNPVDGYHGFSNAKFGSAMGATANYGGTASFKGSGDDVVKAAIDKNVGKLALVKEIDSENDWKIVEVSFLEFWGYGGLGLEGRERTLEFASGAYTPDNYVTDEWAILVDKSDASWSTGLNWYNGGGNKISATVNAADHSFGDKLYFSFLTNVVDGSKPKGVGVTEFSYRVAKSRIAVFIE